LVLDAFGDALETEPCCEIDDAASDLLVAAIGREVPDERLVDLELRDRQALEVRERGVAGAESSLAWRTAPASTCSRSTLTTR